jgi:perosamine synthetase
MMTNIPLSRPDITSAEIRAVVRVLKSPWLSLGPRLPEFERRFAAYVGSREAVAVNSGTSGLHLCVRALGIGEGDEVLTTPFSFVASANCLLFERAKPVFVDIDPNTLNLDLDRLEDAAKASKRRKARLKAVLPVHVFGRPCEMDAIAAIARAYDLEVIEDACEALGAEYRGAAARRWRKVGTLGRLGVFAFYPNKQMTLGEGGIIVTDDPRLASLCRSFRNQGRSEAGAWLQHERLGYNYRLSEIQCALGIAQLARIRGMLAKRERVARMYAERLENVEGIIIPPGPGARQRLSWFVYVVRLSGDFHRKDRDAILGGLRKKGIGCSDYFVPIHLQPFYRELFGFGPGDFPVTESVSGRTIALPFHNNLGESEVDFVCGTLRRLVERR